jgi:hypothetical protein
MLTFVLAFAAGLLGYAALSRRRAGGRKAPGRFAAAGTRLPLDLFDELEDGPDFFTSQTQQRAEKPKRIPLRLCASPGTTRKLAISDGTSRESRHNRRLLAPGPWPFRAAQFPRSMNAHVSRRDGSAVKKGFLTSIGDRPC